jgi:hypothetical protein
MGGDIQGKCYFSQKKIYVVIWQNRLKAKSIIND